MLKWYLVSAKFTEPQEDGTFKRVTKKYLIQGVSYSDAEMRTFEELKSVMKKGGEVVGMARVNVHKIIEGESSQFFIIKISFEQASDDGKKPKKVTHNIFMRAHTAEDAVSGLRKLIKKEYPDFTLESFAHSDVQFAFPVNDGTGATVYSREVDEDDEETPEAKEVDLQKVNDDLLKEVAPEVAAKAPEKAKATVKAKDKAEPKKETKPKAEPKAEVKEETVDEYALPK